ncbi:MAG: FkbM family methyltransferase [Hyphomicrobiales bacterium]
MIIEKLKLKNRIRRARSRMDDPRFFEKELFLLEFLVNGGTAIDVGANKGLYAYGLSQVADRVLCFEANPALAKLLIKSVPHNCEVISKAVSTQNGTCVLNIPATDKGTPSVNTATLEAVPGNLATTVEVEMVSLDDVYADYNLTNVSFIKVDVEGHEEGVINGAKALIEKERPTVMLEFNNPADAPSQRLFTYFADQNYIAMQLAGRTLKALPSHPLTLNGRNVLFFPLEK